jgi:hypothetical protein
MSSSNDYAKMYSIGTYNDTSKRFYIEGNHNHVGINRVPDLSYSLVIDNHDVEISGTTYSDIKSLKTTGDVDIESNLTVGNHITLNGADFKLWKAERGGTGTSEGRALVHQGDGTKESSVLSINHNSDFGGGTKINGNLGINTSASSSYTLDVAGSANVSSNLTVAGDCTITSDLTASQLTADHIFCRGESQNVTGTTYENTFMTFKTPGANDQVSFRNISDDSNKIKFCIDFQDDGNDTDFRIRDWRTSGSNTVTNCFRVTRDLTEVYNNLTVGSNLTVGGTSDLNGNLDVSGTANVSSNLTVGGTSDLNGNLDVSGTANVSGFFKAESATIGSDGTLNIGSINNSSSADNSSTESIIIQTQIDGKTIHDSDFTTYGNAVADSRKSLCLQPYDGNVGIGTINPSANLDVNGDANVSSDLTVGGRLETLSHFDVNFSKAATTDSRRFFWIMQFHENDTKDHIAKIDIDYNINFIKVNSGLSSNYGKSCGIVRFSSIRTPSTSPHSSGYKKIHKVYDDVFLSTQGDAYEPQWYYIRFNGYGYLCVSLSFNEAKGMEYNIKATISYLSANQNISIFNGNVYSTPSSLGTTFTSLSEIYPSAGTDDANWDSTMTSSSTAEVFESVYKGVNITNDLTVGTAGASGNRSIYIEAGQYNEAGIYFGTRYQSSSAVKTAIIAEGVGYSKSKLHFCLNNNNDNNASYSTSLSESKMSLNEDGYLDVNGTCEASDFNATSDVRLKENIIPLEGSLAKVLQLEGKQYNWKKDEDKNLKSGLIAQEVEKIIPEVVHTKPVVDDADGDENSEGKSNEEGMKSINYNGLVPYLVECIKELNSKIDRLESTIKN